MIYMKILIYQPRISYYIGGGEIVPMNHIKFLLKEGHECTLVTTDEGPVIFSEVFLNFLKENQNLSVKFIRIPKDLYWIYSTLPGQDWTRWDNESIFISKLAISTINLCEESDIYITHNIIDTLGIPEGKKTILHLHGFPEKLNYLCERILLHPGYKLIAVSDLVKEKFIQLLGGKVSLDISTSKNGIDINWFKPPKFNFKKSKNILYIGRLLESKGVQNLIKALALFEDETICLDIGGVGPYKNILEELARTLNIEHRVHFLGYIPLEELPTIYSSHYISFLPSLSKEGVLTTLLESIACGTPVATSNNSSMTEFITSGYNGFLFDPDNVLSILSTLKQVYSLNERDYSKIVETALYEIHDQWSWNKKIKEIIKLYEQ